MDRTISEESLATKRGWIKIQDQGDRTVIDERDVHPSTEHAGFHADACVLQGTDKLVENRFGHSRRRSPGEAGTSPTPRIGEQCELGYGQYIAPDVEHGSVHLPVIVAEDPHFDEFLRHRSKILLIVARSDADQQQQSGADPANNAVIHGYGRGRDALNDDPHRYTPRRLLAKSMTRRTPRSSSSAITASSSSSNLSRVSCA